MQVKRHILAGFAVATFAATAVFAGSHSDSPEAKATKARQAHMQLYAHNLGALGAMAKGAVDFDAGAAQAAADNLAALATMNQMSYWLPNSSSDDVEGSRTLAAMWDDIPGAMKAGEGLAGAAMAMQAAAGTLEGVQGAIGAVGGACGACHKAYRQPN